MKRILQSIFCLLPLFFLVPAGMCQPSENITFDRLTPDDGLSQSTVYNMLQDSDGFMWFATQDGLNRYDGYQFKTYLHNPDEPGSISYNRISTIYEDSRGTLWVGTLGRGLNRFDRDMNTFVYYPVDPERSDAGYYGNSVSDILEDSHGNFWIGKSNGLFRMNRETGELVRHTSEPDNPQTLTGNSITKIYEDSNGTLWIGTRSGLNRMNREEGTIRRIAADPQDPDALNHPFIYSIYEDSRGTLWIGTRGGGLHRYQEETETFRSYRNEIDKPGSISGNSISAILEDPFGNLWVATENNGLNLFDREQEIFIRYLSEPGNPSSLNTNSLQSLYISDRNRLWVGTFDGGINTTRLDTPRFEHYKPELNRPRSLSHPAVLSFGEDHAGNLWVGTDGGGLNRFDRESREFITYRHIPEDPNSLSSDIILEIFEDPDRRLWLGTYQGGISVFDPENQTFTHYRHDPQDPESLSNDEVWSIFQDREGTIWIGTCSGGLNRFDPETETFHHYMHDPEDPTTLNNNFISSIFEDSRGQLWIGTYGGGLSLMNRENGTFTHYTISNSDLSDNVVVAIHEDGNGILWIATKGGGLNRFDPDTETFTLFTTADGLPNNVLHGILEDDRGHLWISTNYGLSRFNPEEKLFTNYNLVHGLQSREYKEGSYFRDRDGYFYFGGINGFNRFDPDGIIADTVVPTVVLTDFRIFNHSLSPDSNGILRRQIDRAEEITLPHDASVLTLEFAALNFDINKNNRYAYMLEGFDSDWNYVDRRRSATYTNLNPGEYTFRVKAANSDGVWGENAKSLSLIVTPPFWQTTWFYLLSFFMVVGIAGGILRWRDRNIIEHKKRLQKAVTRQTSELSLKNSELKETLKELNDTRSELVEKAHKAGMADLATNVLHNVGNILNSVNVAATMIDKTLHNSKTQNLKQANNLLREHIDNLDEFLLKNPKGKKLLHYYIKLEEPIDREFEELKLQNKRLAENIKLITDVVTAQQSFANAGRIYERLSLEKLVEDTLILQSATIERHGLNIQKDYQPVEKVDVEKSKMVHVLVNILKNAKESMADIETEKKNLELKIFQDENYVHLTVKDNGCGIRQENINKIFTHGFTTKTGGHGFGLHSCVNYMKEINGEINIESDGEGKGTTVMISIPKKHNGQYTSNHSPRTAEVLDFELNSKPFNM